MKNLTFLVAAASVCSSVLASNPIEKIEQQFPKNVGDFLFLKKALVPAKTNRVTFQYKVPERANATLTITALNPNRDEAESKREIEASMQNAMEEYAKLEPARVFSKLPDFPDRLIGKGCGPQFQQLSYKSKGRVTTAIFNNFWGFADRHFIRISVVQMEKTANQQLEIQFLNNIRAALGGCK